MDPIDIIEGRVAVLERSDVDTDQIIPKQFLKRIERTGFGEFLFYDWFRSGEIELDAHPILVTGRNFGSGSSREHAVWALKDFGFDAVIALGVVIRGDTPHFEYVAGQAASGIMQAGLSTRVPVMFGVVTADTVEQAADRCEEGTNNKGYEAAIAAIEMANLFREMAQEQGLRGNEKILSHVV